MCTRIHGNPEPLVGMYKDWDGEKTGCTLCGARTSER
jgi:hypothetical protein